MHIDLNAVRAESHAEIGGLIERHAHAIVDRWCACARADEPSAQRVHQVVLRDELPGFLEAMGRALSQPGLPERREHAQAASEHGAQRWQSGWSLSELVRDYQLLRLVIADFLESRLERPLYYREMMAVNLYIDDAIDASITRYIAFRDEAHRQVSEERARALEDLSRRKDEFLAILGHELRNPLAPIRNSLSVMRKVVEPSPHPAMSTSLDVLDRQSQHLGRLVDDLLDIARISRGHFELRPQRIDLKVPVEHAVHTTDPLIKSRGHTLHLSMPDAPIALRADPHRIAQIASNLLNNAAKYTDEGGNIWLTVAREGDHGVIRVRDDGIGIPPDALAHVFELFARVDDPTTTTRDGLGIGLALVQRLAQQHGGSITAHSEGAGKGAVFEVRLPIGAEADGADEGPEAPSGEVLVIQKVPVDKT